MKYILTFALLFAFTSSYGQTLAGFGFDIGVRSFGPRIELYTLKRLRLETGFNISRYSSYSNYIGLKVGLKEMDSKHNFWLGSAYKYKYKGISTFEEEDNSVLS